MPDWPFPSLFAIIMVLIQAFSDSTASRPAGVGLSARKLRRLIPVLFPNTPYRVFRWLLGPSVAQRMVVRDILRSGDTGAAVVLSVDPLWVAVYSEDMDGAFVLQYPQEFVAEYNLT